MKIDSPSLRIWWSFLALLFLADPSAQVRASVCEPAKNFITNIMYAIITYRHGKQLQCWLHLHQIFHLPVLVGRKCSWATNNHILEQMWISVDDFNRNFTPLYKIYNHTAPKILTSHHLILGRPVVRAAGGSATVWRHDCSQVWGESMPESNAHKS